MNSDGIILSFHFMCLIVTAGLLSYCSWKYTQNESTSLVDFRVYHNNKKDIYPSFSLCFEGDGIYNTDKFNNITEYKRFLRGEYWDGQMSEIDYDDVTMNFKDYVEYVFIRSHDISEAMYKWNNNKFKYTMPNVQKQNLTQELFPFSTSFRGADKKCW